MRIFNLKKKNWRLLTLFLTAALVLVLGGKAIAAWGPSRPTFTWNNPPSYITFNSFTNNPVIGDERAFATAKKSTEPAFHDPVTNVKDGDQIDISVYFHNNAAENLNLKATNTRVSILLPDPSKFQTETFASAQISADNATPKAVWDTADIKGDQPFSLEYVKGSARLVNNIFTAGSGGTILGDDVITENGTLVGFDKIDGVVPGCERFSGYVNIRVKVKMQPAPVTPQFACTLLDAKVQPNRKVDASVTFTATGGATFKNVTFDWGDSNTTLTTNTSASHTYGADGNYTIKGTLRFNVGETEQSAICSKSITITTPVTPAAAAPAAPAPAPAPAALPVTGPGAAVAAIFAGVSTFAGIFHYLWSGRKFNGDL